MKTLLKSILIGLLIGTQAYAGLPPTTIQGQSDTSAKTKMAFQVPNSQATDLGGIKALIETGNENLLKNPNFQATGITTSSVPSWTLGTGVTAAVETTTKIGNDAQSLKLTLSSASGDLLYQDVTLSGSVNTLKLEAGDYINTSVSGLQICPRLSGTTITSGTSCTNIQANGVWQYWPANMLGGTGSAGVSLYAASAVSGTVYVSHAYTGIARNYAQVIQSNWLGSITISGCTGNVWSTTSATFADMTNSGCTYTASGALSAPSSTWPGFQVASLGAGVLQIQAKGRLGSASNANAASYFEFYDGTNEWDAGSTNAGASAAPNVPNLTGTAKYTTPQTNLNLRIRARAESGQTAQIYGNSTIQALTLDVYYFPSQSGLAVTASQQWQPTVTKLLSGSGTYTVPTGVSRLEVEMVGGGGGGGAGAAGAGAPGTGGGTTTFGTSLLSCTGGSGGPSGGGGVTGGAGGSCTVNSPAIQIASVAGGSGSGSVNGATVGYTGGAGGANPFGGAGGAYGGAANGSAGATNTGAGGGGGGGSSGGSFGGNGGGAGGYAHVMIPFPSSSYSYSIGTGGTGGSSTSNGGNGGSGVIIVKEYYYAANAPQFPGQVTSNTSGQLRIESIDFNCATSSSVSRSSSSWYTSVSNRSSGDCTVTWPSTTFSAAPTCVSTMSQDSSIFLKQTSAATTTGITVGGVTTGGSATGIDYLVSMICIGPR